LSEPEVFNRPGCSPPTSVAVTAFRVTLTVMSRARPLLEADRVARAVHRDDVAPAGERDLVLCTVDLDNPCPRIPHRG
jgi:hypothetical protein